MLLDLHKHKPYCNISCSRTIFPNIVFGFMFKVSVEKEPASLTRLLCKLFTPYATELQCLTFRSCFRS